VQDYDIQFFPRLTEVPGTAQRAIHRIEGVFPDAQAWKPERWMQSNTEKDLGDNDPAKWWWGWGSGATACSGKDFAMIGMCLSDLKERPMTDKSKS
jgi:cytochrome P450